MITFVLKIIQIMMVGIDLETPLYEIGVSGLHYIKDANHLFLICGFTQIVVTQLLNSEFQEASLFHWNYSKTFSQGIAF